MSPPDISVVIATRDRWTMLARTLRGALAQRGVEHEVIVVDDGSQDETSDRLAAVGDGRLRVIQHEQSRGKVAARNAGIAEARGEWLGFLDDDDLWSPDKLRLQLAAARSADATLAYCAALIVDEELRGLEVYPAPDPADPIRVLLPRLAIPAGASNVLASTSAVRAAGGFDDRLGHFEDWDLWLRLLEGGRAAASPEVLMAYVQHEGGSLVTERERVVHDFGLLAAKHRELSRGRGVGFDRAGLDGYLAWAEERAGHRLQAARHYLVSAARYAGQGDRWGARAGAAHAIGVLRGRRYLDSGRPFPSAPLGDEPEWLELYR